MKSTKKIKAPVTKGAAKVPVVMQMEALECGAASLAMILAYYEKWIPLEQVRLDCGVSRDGSNARNILRAARSYGLSAKGYRYEPETLKKEGKFPCIIHWNFKREYKSGAFSAHKSASRTFAGAYKLALRNGSAYDGCFPCDEGRVYRRYDYGVSGLSFVVHFSRDVADFRRTVASGNAHRYGTD